MFLGLGLKAWLVCAGFFAWPLFLFLYPIGLYQQTLGKDDRVFHYKYAFGGFPQLSYLHTLLWIGPLFYFFWPESIPSQIVLLIMGVWWPIVWFIVSAMYIHYLYKTKREMGYSKTGSQHFLDVLQEWLLLSLPAVGMVFIVVCCEYFDDV